MGRVVIETESLVAFHGANGPGCGGDVKGDFRRMNFQPEVDVDLVEFV